jgi:hypothetical protein
MLEQTMKPKLILCLALALSGGLFGCSTTARRADGTATNAPLQIRFIEPWTNITIKLVVPGSSGTNAIKSKTVEIQARQAVYEIVQNLGSRTEPILGEQYLLVVHDPFTKKFCFVEGKLDFYVSDRSGMKGYGYNSGTIDPSGVSIEFADSKLDYNSAIAQFKKNIDVQKMADLEIWGELEYDVAMTPKPMDEQKKDEMQSKAEQMISKTINFGNAFDSFDLSDEHPPVIEGVDITDGIMRLDFRETASTKRPASVWIDLKTKKAIRCLEDGQEMRLERMGPLMHITYDLRPQLYSCFWTNGVRLYSYESNNLYGVLAVKLKQSKVPTEEKALDLVEDMYGKPGGIDLDSKTAIQVTALLTLNKYDSELGDKDDFVWEVRMLQHDESCVGLIWVDALTGKVKILYPK